MTLSGFLCDGDTSSRSDMIRLGIIGYGYWGPNLVRNFVEARGSQVIAVSDLRQERLSLVKARYPSIKTTTNHQELFVDPTIDAIAIATAVSSHFDIAWQALQ